MKQICSKRCLRRLNIFHLIFETRHIRTQLPMVGRFVAKVPNLGSSRRCRLWRLRKKFRQDYGINWVGNENRVHPVIRSKKADEMYKKVSV